MFLWHIICNVDTLLYGWFRHHFALDWLISEEFLNKLSIDSGLNELKNTTDSVGNMES